MTLRSELVGAVEYQRNPDKLLRSGQLVSIVLPCDFAKALAVTESTDLAVASQWIESVLPRKRGICRLGWFTSTTSKPGCAEARSRRRHMNRCLRLRSGSPKQSTKTNAAEPCTRDCCRCGEAPSSHPRRSMTATT